MKPFDLAHTSLSGTHLIEAGAGTGKTYTIAGIYLRLVLEEAVPVERILVVTFTNSATEELKDRIRNKLVDARTAFETGTGEDALIRELLDRSPDPSASLRRLEDALIDFDRAAIFTIHGFCGRILRENAFETGSLFDTELVSDPTALIREVANDFWRSTVNRCPPEAAAYLAAKIGGPDFFGRLLSGKRRPGLTVIPDAAAPELRHLEPFRRAYHALQERWPSARSEVISRLNDPALSGTVYGGLRPDPDLAPLTKRHLRTARLVEEMDRYVAPHGIGIPILDTLERFTVEKIAQSTRRNATAPEHAVFRLCSDLFRVAGPLRSELDAYLVYTKAESFRYADRQLPLRKKGGNIQFFDDLLIQVRDALFPEKTDGDHRLADAVRETYRAALVDEFQDTDLIQYEIFSGIFGCSDSVLFMIGDPKQAIYGFRGADVFSYLAAAKRTDRRHTLIENWRSTPRLIDGVNALFSNVTDPFFFEEIPFQCGISGRNDFDDQEADPSPLKLWIVPPGPDGPLGKTEATESLCHAVVAETVRLAETGIDPGTIAVLVRTNRQAQQLKSRLTGAGMPAVLFSAGNVFDTREAGDLERVLGAICDPTDGRRLKAALATDLFGLSGETIGALDSDLSEWNRSIAAVSEYGRIWRRQGFIQMFRRLINRERVRDRLLAGIDGERRVTNLLQLSEILHRESSERRLGPAGILKWLSEQRDPATPRREADGLRLESDARAVKLITIHKSKGLEFPIVFCPFAWDTLEPGPADFIFHDVERRALTLDLGSPSLQSHRKQALVESLAESLRLLYVSVTRARDRCYLAWGRIRGTETSALSYLIHGAGMATSGDSREDLKNHLSGLSEDRFMADVRQLVERSAGAIEGIEIDDLSGESFRQAPLEKERLFGRMFDGEIDRAWRVLSYSALVSGRPAPAAILDDREMPDHDGIRDISGKGPPASDGEAETGDGKTDSPISAFPGGARAGTFFHDLLEHLDFSDPDPVHLDERVRIGLRSHGFEPTWRETACGMIRRLLSVPFSQAGEGFTLGSIRSDTRISEMEFYFPLRFITPAALQSMFEGRIPFSSGGRADGFYETIGDLTFSPSRGFMKGYIDLVFTHGGRFFLVDWKSNRLGPGPEAYDPASLIRAMGDGNYFLQYHLYALALHLYLKGRLPGYTYDENFGGVFYIFLRGVGLGSRTDSGIFFDRPEPELMARLQGSLVALS